MAVPQTQRACRKTPNAALKFLVDRTERFRSEPRENERSIAERPRERATGAAQSISLSPLTEQRH